MTQTLLACGVCGAETRNAYICGDDTLDLAKTLILMPIRLADLEVSLTRQDRIAADAARSGSSSPLPINVDIIGVLADLQWACDRVHDLTAIDVRRRGPNTMEAAQIIAGHPTGPDLVRRLNAAVKHALKAMDRRAAQWFYGNCEACGTELLAAPDALRVDCRHCDRGYDGLVLRARQMRAMQDMLVTRTEAASLIAGREQMDSPTPVRKAIDKWVERTRLEDRAGRVRLGDVEELWAKRNAMRARKAELAKVS